MTNHDFFGFLGPSVRLKALEIDKLPLELKKCLKGTKMWMEPYQFFLNQPDPGIYIDMITR